MFGLISIKQLQRAPVYVYNLALPLGATLEVPAGQFLALSFWHPSRRLAWLGLAWPIIFANCGALFLFAKYGLCLLLHGKTI